MYNNADAGGSSNPQLRNVILWGDAASSGAEIFNVGAASPVFEHSVIQGSGGSANWNAILGIDGGGNLDADPLLGALADNGGSTQTFLPGTGSSAFDTANSATCPATDQRGISRPQGAGCDIGAVEIDLDTIFIDGFD
jgi:hypothetical protein